MPDKITNQIYDLLNELTQDIKNPKDKDWLKPALVSHVTRLSKAPRRQVQVCVDIWYTDKTGLRRS